MSPILCLESRIHNVVGLPGTYDTPHGLAQLFASRVCARVFLSRLLAEGLVRDALKCIERIYRLCYYDKDGRKIYETKQIDPFEAVQEDPRLPVEFNERRLPQMRQWLAKRRGEAAGK